MADTGILELLNGFVEESRDGLAESESLFESLASGRATADTVNRIFRIFHNIKSASGFLELHWILAVTHEAETLLENVRGGQLAVTPQLVDVLYEATDFLLSALDQTAEKQTDEGAAAAAKSLVERLQQAVSQGRSPDTSTKAPQAAALAVVPEGGTVERSPRVSGELLASSASREDYDPTALGRILVEHQLANELDVEYAVAARKDPIGATLVRMDALSEDDIAQALKIQAELRAGGKVDAAEAKGRLRDARRQQLRVDVQKFDSLLRLVGELTSIQGRVGASVPTEENGEAKVAVEELEAVTHGLRQAVLSLRMVPLETTFRKMQRIVRDVANKLNKSVELHLHGGAAEIDKTVVEAISDPLLHMVRNAVDHGIESAAERERAGKSTTGQIQLVAEHDESELRITVSDDGRGLDRDKILKRAVRNGLVPLSKAHSMEESEVFQLIFEPGLSTAQSVTELSGRGVGMDVVKRNIEAASGEIEVTSRPGLGTTFVIRAPVTLASVEGLVAQVGDAQLVIPRRNVEAAAEGRDDAVFRCEKGREWITFHGSRLPLVKLAGHFGLESSVTDLNSGTYIMVKSGSQRACLFVDSVQRQHQVVISGLNSVSDAQGGPGRSAVLSDGGVGFILDIPCLLAELPD